MSDIRLIPRADTAGMHPLVNRAIRATVTEGIVRNVSLMACGPAIADARDLLGPLEGRVAFGLEVALTAEWQNLRWRPVCDGALAAPFVRPDGTMHDSVDDLIAAGAPLDPVLAEVEAQLDLLLAAGFRVAYLVEHGDIGRLPGLRERLDEFAARRGLVSHHALVEANRIAALPGWNGPGEHPGTELADHLASQAPGTYVLVGRPSTKDEQIARLHRHGESPGGEVIRRNRERRMFMDMEIVDYCENVEIELLKYGDLSRA